MLLFFFFFFFFFLLQLAQHLNTRSDAVKTAIDRDKISQGWFFCTQFEAKLQSMLSVYTITKQCATCYRCHFDRACCCPRNNEIISHTLNSKLWTPQFHNYACKLYVKIYISQVYIFLVMLKKRLSTNLYLPKVPPLIYTHCNY